MASNAKIGLLLGLVVIFVIAFLLNGLHSFINVGGSDDLSDIAKKFYGLTEGNRRANIKRIFEANSKAIESPDRIYPGQKLIIPPLWASNPDKNSVESIFPDSLFEEVDSIGRRHL